MSAWALQPKIAISHGHLHDQQIWPSDDRGPRHAHRSRADLVAQVPARRGSLGRAEPGEDRTTERVLGSSGPLAVCSLGLASHECGHELLGGGNVLAGEVSHVVASTCDGNGGEHLCL